METPTTTSHEPDIPTSASFLTWWQEKVHGNFIEDNDFDTINDGFYQNNRDSHYERAINPLEEEL